MQVLNFSHEYYKLQRPFFTTIRGKTAIKKYRCGPVEIRLKRQHYCDAEIFNIGQAKIKDIPINILARDGEYSGCIINTRQDFIDLLNSFRPPFYAQADLESEVTIFYIRK